MVGSADAGRDGSAGPRSQCDEYGDGPWRGDVECYCGEQGALFGHPAVRLCTQSNGLCVVQIQIPIGSALDRNLADRDRQHPPVSIPLPHPATSASLHPYLRDRFVVGSLNDPWVRVYDLDSGAEREVYKGHHGPVHCASYSPDGEVYASGSEDGTIRLWQTTPGKSYGLWQTAE